jgi:DNA repair protein RAD16
MNVKARDACLKEFREDNNVRVLLMSLKAGGVALNLTWCVRDRKWLISLHYRMFVSHSQYYLFNSANYIYLMDPWWNPAAEM